MDLAEWMGQANFVVTTSNVIARREFLHTHPFKPYRFKQYVKAVDALKKLAASYGKTVAQFALRWAIQQPGMTTAIAGARTVQQVEDNAGVSGWQIRPEDLAKVDEILAKHIKTPVGPEFMAPRP